jgi:hypothetical protein
MTVGTSSVRRCAMVPVSRTHGYVCVRQGGGELAKRTSWPHARSFSDEPGDTRGLLGVGSYGHHDVRAYNDLREPGLGSPTFLRPALHLHPRLGAERPTGGVGRRAVRRRGSAPRGKVKSGRGDGLRPDQTVGQQDAQESLADMLVGGRRSPQGSLPCMVRPLRIRASMRRRTCPRPPVPAVLARATPRPPRGRGVGGRDRASGLVSTS